MRIVPVVLQKDKQYVLLDGTVVIISENPHWQAAPHHWPFMAQVRGVFLYFSPDGRCSCGDNEKLNVARPHYSAGEKYFDGYSTAHFLEVAKEVHEDFKFKSTTKGYYYTGEGSFFLDGIGCENDLQDYVQEEAVVKEIVAPLQGKRADLVIVDDPQPKPAPGVFVPPIWPLEKSEPVAEAQPTLNEADRNAIWDKLHGTDDLDWIIEQRIKLNKRCGCA